MLEDVQQFAALKCYLFRESINSLILLLYKIIESSFQTRMICRIRFIIIISSDQRFLAIVCNILLY